MPTEQQKHKENYPANEPPDIIRFAIATRRTAKEKK
jgi:hypothetical protein